MEPIYPNSSENCTETEDDFELRFSTRPLRILKLITPFLPIGFQPLLAALIRIQELQLILREFHISKTHAFPAFFTAESEHNPQNSHTGSDPFSPELMNRLLQKINPLLNPEEQKEIGKIRQMLQMLETYKQLEPYMSMFSQMTQDNDSKAQTDDAENAGPFPTNLMSMLSPDMMQNLGGLMQLFASGDQTETDSMEEKENHYD